MFLCASTAADHRVKTQKVRKASFQNSRPFAVTRLLNAMDPMQAYHTKRDFKYFHRRRLSSLAWRSSSPGSPPTICATLPSATAVFCNPDGVSPSYRTFVSTEIVKNTHQTYGLSKIYPYLIQDLINNFLPI